MLTRVHLARSVAVTYSAIFTLFQDELSVLNRCDLH